MDDQVRRPWSSGGKSDAMDKSRTSSRTSGSLPYGRIPSSLSSASTPPNSQPNSGSRSSSVLASARNLTPNSSVSELSHSEEAYYSRQVADDGTSIPPPEQIIDEVTAQFNLTSSQAAKLHDISCVSTFKPLLFCYHIYLSVSVEYGRKLERGDLLIRIFQVASAFGTQNILRENQQHNSKMDQIITERISESFKFNENQKV